MQAKERSDAYIKRLFTALRIMVNYDALLEEQEAVRIKPILSGMRIKNPKPRKTAPTENQIIAIS